MDPQQVLHEFIVSTIASYRYHLDLANRAIEQVPNSKMHQPLDTNTNSIVVIMKHIAGNLRSRWTDFLTTDGEKPWRNRDDEFVDTFESREELVDYWQQGWDCVFESLEALTIDDLGATVTIRGEPHTVPRAIERSLAHTSYHVGQIVMVARIHCGDQWTTLTIPRGGSQQYNREHWEPNLMEAYDSGRPDE